MRIMRHRPDGRIQIASARKPTAIAVGYLSAQTVAVDGSEVYYRMYARRVRINFFAGFYRLLLRTVDDRREVSVIEESESVSEAESTAYGGDEGG